MPLPARLPSVANQSSQGAQFGGSGDGLNATALDAERAAADAHLNFPDIVAVLVEWQWDASVLARLLPALQRHLPESPLAIQLEWNAAVQNAWPLILRQLERSGLDLAFPLGVVAASSRCWRSAIGYFSASLQQWGAHPATHYNLAMVYWQLGQHAQAEHQLRQAFAAAPGVTRYRKKLKRLLRWRGVCRVRLGADAVDGGDPSCEIRATLLGPQHAAALLAQHNAADILAMVRLQPLHDLDAALAWIASHTEHDDLTAWGVMHPEHGLVGVFVLRANGDAAVFHYWIGAEFRGRGYGRGALRLLKRIAIRRRLRYLFTSAFANNLRSLAALRAAGFRPMSDVVEASQEALPFYCLAVPATPAGATPDTELALLNRVLHGAAMVGAMRVAPASDGR
ncbi:GNAT family N-acetyltransferase [Oxalobacteraceae bacterium]|nr:GNAT family N-acetyltransferase [Oxalobacteraceae bacterium]